MDFDTAITSLVQKFTSGNDIPVERSVILRSEFDAIISEMIKAELVSASAMANLTNGG